jgi:hypothetical protein
LGGTGGRSGKKAATRSRSPPLSLLPKASALGEAFERRLISHRFGLSVTVSSKNSRVNSIQEQPFHCSAGHNRSGPRSPITTIAWHSGNSKRDAEFRRYRARARRELHSRGGGSTGSNPGWGDHQKSQLRGHACFCKQLASRFGARAARRAEQAGRDPGTQRPR